MKYEVKRKKVYEVNIDFENGCIIKITKDNLLGLEARESEVMHNLWSDDKVYDVDVFLTENIKFMLEHINKELLNDIRSLFE